MRIAVEESHGVVFVDNLSAAANIEEESGTELGRAAEALIHAVRANRLTGIFDHHHRKKKGAVQDMARGGTATGGAVDVILDMERQGGATSRRRKLTARGRLRATTWQRVVEWTEDGRDYLEVQGETDGNGVPDDAFQRLFVDRQTLSEMREATAPDRG